MGRIHGGWYATLLDSALGCAVHTLMPRRPRLHHRRAGRLRTTAEARLVAPDGALNAHSTATWFVFELAAQFRA
ncbi:MAG: hotdog domain-containing protein [Curvibacter sp.]|jgi:acyl-coenzyme A thioesterase PaaI-like protein